MRAEHMFVIWSCIRIKGEVTREKKTGLSPTSSFPTDRSKAVPLLQFFFLRWWFHM